MLIWRKGGSAAMKIGQWLEHAENTFEHYNGKYPAVPTARKPDF